jgi:hypothetical protein
MSPNADAAGNGVAPTGTTSITRFVAGSIRESVFEPVFGTYTVPSSAIAGFSGRLPTRIVATTLSVLGLSLETVFERRFETQIAVREAGERARPSPDGDRADLVRARVDPGDLPTELRPHPDGAGAIAKVRGALKPGTLIFLTARFVRRLILATKFWLEPVAQTAFAPNVMSQI